MAGITLESAQAQLDAWLAASLAVAQSQSYEIDTGNGGRRTMTRVNAEHIDRMINYWRNMVRQLEGGRPGRRVRQLAPSF
jgi:hypothetical protein